MVINNIIIIIIISININYFKLQIYIIQNTMDYILGLSVSSKH